MHRAATPRRHTAPPHRGSRAAYVAGTDRIRAGDRMQDVIADRAVQLDRALRAVEHAVAAF